MAALNQAKIITGLEELTANLNKSTFFFEFLKVYGFSKSTIQKLEKNDRTRNIGLIPGDLGLTKQIYFRPILDGDVNVELENILKNPSIKQNKVRFVIVTDFKTLSAYDFLVDDSISIDINDLRSNYDFFLPLTGKYEKPSAYSAHPADVKACEKMGRLYDNIKVLNHYDDSNLHSLNIFLTRLLFCFFAEDTGIFPVKGQMTNAMMSLTKSDGSDLPEFFQDLFKILDLPESSTERKEFSATLQKFPYVNGGLFREACEIPLLDAKARNILVDCGRLTWSEISPVIFGSMFQSVMNPELRHELGAHYTSEENIFKVIGPLFLDDLRAEFETIKELKTKSLKIKRLREFQIKLSNITCLDPAAGCGNFLVITFRELKTLELEIVTLLLNLEGKKERSVFMDWTAEYSKVSINQFYGIEIEEFPVDIARVSMWLMEHVMNKRFGEKLGAVIPSIPLRNSAHIINANSLVIDWRSLVPLDRLTFIFGNPPFCGRRSRTPEQVEEVATYFDYKDIDYVACWFKKAAKYIRNTTIRAAFVATNSISQGEQVSPLWKEIFDWGIHIDFAWQTFIWDSQAKGKAHVHCVIVGFSCCDVPKVLMSSHGEKRIVTHINGYLIDAPDVFLPIRSIPLCDVPKMKNGNVPLDGDALKVEAADAHLFKDCGFLKRLMGGRELLHSEIRYVLWLVDVAPEVIRQYPAVLERVNLCRKNRLAMKDPGTKKLAATPETFRDTANPHQYIALPMVSSEKRDYIPMDFLYEDTIPTNQIQTIPNATLYVFGILMSKAHVAWMKTVAGRLGMSFRYSKDVVYNNFPWPAVNELQKDLISNLAMNVLSARELYPNKTLADLYTPEKMPHELRRAHHELDMAVDQLYRKKGFETDEERLGHLFKCYAKLTSDCSMIGLQEED